MDAAETPCDAKTGGLVQRALTTAASATVAATAVVAFATLTAAPASAAENDYQSDPDCQNGESIPADIVTRAVDGWRFSASCKVSYTGNPTNPVPAGISSWDAVFVSDQDVSRAAHIRFFCAEKTPDPNDDQTEDNGSLRGIAADGSEVFRIEPTRSDHKNGQGWPNHDVSICKNDN